MSQDPNPTGTPEVTSARREKLAAIAAVLGQDVAARLEPVGTAPPGRNADAVSADRTLAADPERLAWQKNRLIQRLRTASESTPTRSRTQDTPRVRRAFDLPGASGTGGLSGEHPAIIAHLLRAEPQTHRVKVLRTLPGPVARSVMQRLRRMVD